MGLLDWFRPHTRDTENSVLLHDHKVEIVASKQATVDQIKEIHRANDSLQRVLDKNHFTIKIFVAAGGDNPVQK